MPANLTPEYERAERQFRQASTDAERLDALREMLRAIPKHKGTEKMQADLKRRISQLRKAAAKKGPSKGPDPFHIPRSGAGQVVLLGTPNAGKSSLVAVTTNASVKVADYPFTTALPAPGMWQFEDVQIELVDTPPVTAGHVPPGLWGTIRSADVLCLVIDAAANPLEQIEIVTDLLTERELVLRPAPRTDLDPTDPSQYSALLVATKADLAGAENVDALRELYDGTLEVLPVSAETGEGLEALRDELWRMLGVVRVYTKKPGKPADFEKPFTLPLGATVDDLARQIHRELPDNMKYARIWGAGRFDGQHVHHTEILRDKDVVEIHG